MNETTPAESNSNPDKDQDRQQDVINRLLFASLDEQRRARRWGIFFKSLTFSYLFLLFILFFYAGEDSTLRTGLGEHTALVEVEGIISDTSAASADNVVQGLRDAFENKNTKGVILRINSPGGSPVQAGYINDEIQRLKEQYQEIPVYAVISDIGASGGYYIAAAANEIYADKASLVGSIGVSMNSFGFVDTLNMLGVERRLYTAGENKGFLDPFSPEEEADVEHVETMLNNIHDQFVNVVREGRGDKLKETPELYTGLVWTGEQSLEMGLIDGLGSASYVARELIGAEDIVDFTQREQFLGLFADLISSKVADILATKTGLNEPSLR